MLLEYIVVAGNKSRQCDVDVQSMQSFVPLPRPGSSVAGAGRRRWLQLGQAEQVVLPAQAVAVGQAVALWTLNLPAV